MSHRNALLVLSAVLAACGGSTDGDSGPEPVSSVATSQSAPEPAAAVPQLPRTPAPDGASVYIIAPENGAAVANPIRIVFGLRGFGVAPAGIERPDAGHHHLLIDTELPPLSAPIPADDRHRHFGLGQTETELTLPAGEHRLQLLLGDHLHVPHDPPLMSEPVTIRVTE
jgi:hypothetical protein